MKIGLSSYTLPWAVGSWDRLEIEWLDNFNQGGGFGY
jgi:hypothetical protein